MSGSKVLGLDEFEDGEIVSGGDSTRAESSLGRLKDDLEDVSSDETVFSWDSLELPVKTGRPRPTTEGGKKNSKEKTFKLKDVQPGTSAGNKKPCRRRQKRKRPRCDSTSSDSNSGIGGCVGSFEVVPKVATKRDSTKSRGRSRKCGKSPRVVADLVAAVSRQNCIPRNVDSDPSVNNLRSRLLNTGLLSDPGPSCEFDDVGQVLETNHDISSHEETGNKALNLSTCENILDDEFVADHVPTVGTLEQTSPSLHPSVVEKSKFCGEEATVDESLSLEACQQRDDDGEETIEALREKALRSSAKIGRVALQDVGATEDLDDLQNLRIAALRTAIVGKHRIRQARKAQLAAKQKEGLGLPSEFGDSADYDKTTVPVDMDLALSDVEELGISQGLNDSEDSTLYVPERWAPLETQDSDHATKCVDQVSGHLFLAVTDANSVQLMPTKEPPTFEPAFLISTVGNIAGTEKDSSCKVVQMVPAVSGKGMSCKPAPTGVKNIDVSRFRTSDVMALNQIRDNFASKGSFSVPPSQDTANGSCSRFGTDELSQRQSLAKIKSNASLALIPIPRFKKKTDEGKITKKTPVISAVLNLSPTVIPRGKFNYTGSPSTSSGTGPIRKVGFNGDRSKRFVIKLGQDSDSEDEKCVPLNYRHLDQTVVNELGSKNKPSTVNMFQGSPDFGKKVDAFLKTTRMEHERKTPPKPSATSKRTTPVNDVVLAASSSSTFVTAGPTVWRNSGPKPQESTSTSVSSTSVATRSIGLNPTIPKPHLSAECIAKTPPAASAMACVQGPRMVEPAPPEVKARKIAKPRRTLLGKTIAVADMSKAGVTDTLAVAGAAVSEACMQGPSMARPVARVGEIAKPRKAKPLTHEKIARTLTVAQAALSKASIQMEDYNRKSVRPDAMFANINSVVFAAFAEQPLMLDDATDPVKITSATWNSGDYFFKTRCDDALHVSTEIQSKTRPTASLTTSAAPVLDTGPPVPLTQKVAPARPSEMPSMPNAELTKCKGELLTTRIRFVCNVKFIKDAMSSIRNSEAILNTQRTIIADQQSQAARAMQEIKKAKAILDKEKKNENNVVTNLLKGVADLDLQLATIQNLESSCEQLGSLIGLQYKSPGNLEAEASPGPAAVGEESLAEPCRARLEAGAVGEGGAAQVAEASPSRCGPAQRQSVPGIPTQSGTNLPKPMGDSNQRNSEVALIQDKVDGMSAGRVKRWNVGRPIHRTSGSQGQPASPPQPLNNSVDFCIRQTAFERRVMPASQVNGVMKPAAAIRPAGTPRPAVPGQGRTMWRTAWRRPEQRSSEERASDLSSVMCPYGATGNCIDPLCMFSHSVVVDHDQQANLPSRQV